MSPRPARRALPLALVGFAGLAGAVGWLAARALEEPAGGALEGAGRALPDGARDGDGPPALDAPRERGGSRAGPRDRTDATARAGPRDAARPLPGGLGLELDVRDDAGQPLSILAFHARRAGEEAVAGRERFVQSVGSSDGRFALTGFTPGSWIVVVDPTPEGWPGWATREEVSATLPREDDAPIAVVLRRAGAVQGLVVDGNGDPLPGVTVVANTERGTQRQSAGASGSFAFPALPAGAAQLSASGHGVEVVEVIDVEPGGEVIGIVLRFPGGGTIAGEVLDAQGRPIAGCEVMLLADDEGLGQKETDDAGRFTFGPLQPGEYTVAAADVRHSDDKERFFEHLMTATVAVADGETSHVTLAPDAGAPIEVHGHLTDGGEPVPDRQLFAFREGAELLASARAARTDAAGAYEMRVDAPGRYVVLMESGMPVPIAHVDVPAQPRVRVDLVVPGGRVSGRIPGGDRHWRLELSREDGYLELELPDSADGRFADDEGRFDLRAVRPGTYVLQARHPDGRTAGPLRGLEVGDGEHVQGLELVPVQGATLEVLVLDADREPRSGARVIARDAHGTPLGHGEPVGPPGLYRIAGIPPGKARVSAQAGALAALGATDVTEDGETLELVLAPGGRVRATARDGNAPARAAIRLFGPEGDELTALEGGTGSFRTVLSFSERTFGPLPAGVYTVVASAVDGRRVEGQARVVSGEVAEVELEL